MYLYNHFEIVIAHICQKIKIFYVPQIFKRYPPGLHFAYLP